MFIVQWIITICRALFLGREGSSSERILVSPRDRQTHHFWVIYRHLLLLIVDIICGRHQQPNKRNKTSQAAVCVSRARYSEKTASGRQPANRKRRRKEANRPKIHFYSRYFIVSNKTTTHWLAAAERQKDGEEKKREIVIKFYGSSGCLPASLDEAWIIHMKALKNSSNSICLEVMSSPNCFWFDLRAAL